MTDTFLMRAVVPEDCAELTQRLPSLLPGDWSLAALQNTPYRQRVLVQADDTRRLLGFAEYYQVLDECHLLGVTIWPELQRQGLGRRLLEEVLAEAKSEGCTQCLLEVRRSNVAACALYRRLGFVEVGCRRAYYPPLQAGSEREDALLFSLSLD